MATQVQVTPPLYGEDAKSVLKQISRKPTKDQREKLRRYYQARFEGVKKRGL